MDNALLFNLKEASQVKDVDTYSCTVHGKKVKVSQASEICVALACEGPVCPHMGLLAKNTFHVEDKVYNWGLIHLLPDGIFVEFAIEFATLETRMKSIGKNTKLLLSSWVLNRTPLHQITTVITSTFSVARGDGNKWVPNSFGITIKAGEGEDKKKITTSIVAITNAQDIEWINCKRFMQIMAGVFHFAIPEEMKKQFEKEALEKNLKIIPSQFESVGLLDQSKRNITETFN